MLRSEDAIPNWEQEREKIFSRGLKNDTDDVTGTEISGSGSKFHSLVLPNSFQTR